MSNYNLTDNLSDSFTFNATIKGKDNSYVVKYPSQKELEPISRGYARLRVLDEDLAAGKTTKEKVEAEVKDIEKEMSDAFSKLFEAQDGSMPITELLENLPINAKKNFDKMVQTEFGNEE